MGNIDKEELLARQKELQDKINGVNDDIKHNSEVTKNQAKLKSNEEALERLSQFAFGCNDRAIQDIKDKISDVERKNTINAKALAEELEKKVDVSCPTCNQHLPQDKVDLAKSNIEGQIVILKKLGAEYETTLESYDNELEDLIANNTKEVNEEKKLGIETAIIEAQEFLASNKPREIINLEEAQKELNVITQSLGYLPLIEDYKKNLSNYETELVGLEKELSLTRSEISIANDFINEKVRMIEDQISHKFKYVKIKLFEEKKNGVIKDVFKIVDARNGIEGTNTATILLGQIELAIAYQDLMGVDVPLLVDNSESVDHFPPFNRQIIRAAVKQK
jgi:hypothetical protein